MSRILYKEYRNLIKNGSKIYNKFYIIYYIKYHSLRLKAAAKKNTGNAIRRNYEKRTIRNILSGLRFNDKYLILVISIRPNDLSFSQKSRLLSGCLAPII